MAAEAAQATENTQACILTNTVLTPFGQACAIASLVQSLAAHRVGLSAGYRIAADVFDALVPTDGTVLP